MDRIATIAPAKTNLHLRVLGKRPDGFHDLETIFLKLAFGDRLEFRLDRTLRLECRGHAEVPQDESNLVIRAGRALQDMTHCRKGAKISLEKVIPMGAGLGGGSSDAASTLIALNRLWELGLPDVKLMELAAELGSDVPFFVLNQQVALGRGRGEKLVGLPDFPAKWLVLVDPGIHVSTAWAYGKLTNLLTAYKENVNLEGLYRDCLQGQTGIDALLVNDFERIVFPEYPEIGEIKESLIRENAEGALLSGSGASVVGIFGDETNARQWVQTHRQHRTFVTRPWHQ